jgi:Ca2+-transporting ATPase
MPLLKQGIFSNRFGSFWLLSMAMLTVLITNVATIFPFIKTASLSLLVWPEILFIVIVSTFWIEVKKIVMKSDEEKVPREGVLKWIR